MSTFTVGYFVGSLAQRSINRKLAARSCASRRRSCEMREIPIGELPLYSYDYDADYPAAGARAEGGDRRRSTPCCS